MKRTFVRGNSPKASVSKPTSVYWTIQNNAHQWDTSDQNRTCLVKCTMSAKASCAGNFSTTLCSLSKKHNIYLIFELDNVKFNH